MSSTQCQAVQLRQIWADISNAKQGFKDCSTTRLVLDEVLGLELSNFVRLLKLRPGVNDDHLLVQQVADDLWFRQMDHAENEQGRTVRKNMTSAEEDLMALALHTKPHTNAWLYLSPRLCTLGEDAFEHAPAVIKEIHAYLKNLLNERELAGGMMLQLMQIPSQYFGHESTIRAIRRYLGWNGSGIDAILLVNMLPMGIPEPDRELCHGYPETVEWLDISLVCDIWSRELREGTCESLHPSFGRPEIGRAPHPDRYDVWSVGRSARAIALPRTNSGNES